MPVKIDRVICEIVGLVLGVVLGWALILYCYSVFVLGAPSGL